MSCPDSRSFTPGNFFNASLKFFVELAHSFASTATALNGVFFTLSTLDAVTVNSSNISASSGITRLTVAATPFSTVTRCFTVLYPIADTTNVYWPTGAFSTKKTLRSDTQPYDVPSKDTVAKSTGLLSSETNFPDITHFPLFGDTLSISFTTIPAKRGKDEKNRSKMFNTLTIFILALFFWVENYMVFKCLTIL